MMKMMMFLADVDVDYYIISIKFPGSVVGD